MNIDIHPRRIEIQKQNKGRMSSMKKNIPVGLLNGVRDELVADDAAIDEEILEVSLTARKGR